MGRLLVHFASSALVFWAASASAQNREGETRVSLIVSPTWLDFSGYGGAQSALSAELRATRYFNRTIGGQVSMFALVPAGVTSIQSLCPTTTACEGSRKSPNLLHGVLASGLLAIGETGIRVSAGGGALHAAGVEGSTRRSTAVVTGGLEWVPDGSGKFTPSFGLRVVHLLQPIAGARAIFLPGVGMTF